MSLFQSLGSNYTKSSVRQSFSQKTVSELETALVNQVLPGIKFKDITWWAQGRQAISAAISQIKAENKKANTFIAIQGFTCWAVEEAVRQTSTKPVFLDVAPNQLQFGLKQLKTAYQQQPFSGLIIQSTLGFVHSEAEYQAISDYCQKHKIKIIIDAAHGGLNDYLLDKADFLAISFGRDKLIDGVTGGALISFKTKPVTQPPPPTNQPNRYQVYPLLTYLIRSAYRFKLLGKIVHKTIQNLNLFESSVKPAKSKNYNLKFSGLLFQQLSAYTSSINHRRKIAQIYQQNLPQEYQFELKTLQTSQPLRYPLKLKSNRQRQQLLTKLKQNGYYLQDVWYDSVVAIGKQSNAQSMYQQQTCPNAEQLTQVIVNLPTHININQQQARDLCQLINQIL